jgi:hypothetical protein
MAQYRLLHQLGLDDAKKCVKDFGASLTLEAKALAQGQVIDLTDKAYAFLTLPKPKGRGHSSLLEPVGKVAGQAKDAELRGPAK